MLRQRWSTSFWRVIVLATFVVFATSTLQAPVAAQNNDSITIPLNEYENSGVSGTATLEAIGDGTRVVMELSGDAVTGNHPTHIHTGTCANFDPNPTYPLTTVILDDVSDAGLSETTVEGVRLRDLLRDDYVILVHKSAEELTNYLVCGDIKADGATGGSRNEAAATVEGTPGADNVTASVDEAPRAGVGSGNAGVSRTTLLASLAVVFALCSAALLFKRGAHG
jgi:hypothetical protein